MGSFGTSARIMTPPHHPFCMVPTWKMKQQQELDKSWVQSLQSLPDYLPRYYHDYFQLDQPHQMLLNIQHYESHGKCFRTSYHICLKLKILITTELIWFFILEKLHKGPLMVLGYLSLEMVIIYFLALLTLRIKIP